MDFYDIIDKRRTVRDFLDEDIPNDVIERIIEAAFKAPTNDHMRDWEYILINDKKVMEKALKTVPKGITNEELEELFVNWNLNDKLQQECYRNAVPKQYRMFLDAKYMIIPLLKEKVDILHPENLSHLNGFASIWCSIENLLLAATYEGYGCSLRIPLNDEDSILKQELNIPEGYFIPCILGIGKEDTSKPRNKQKEIDVKERMHWNKF